MPKKKTAPHPITVLESHAAEAGWNENTMLAIACDFLRIRGLADPKLAAAFETYVAARLSEELATDTDGQDRESYSDSQNRDSYTA